MNPNDRLPHRLMQLSDSGAPLSRALTTEILDKIDWYRKQLYDATAELNILKKRASADSWRTNPDRMGGSFSNDEITKTNEWR